MARLLADRPHGDLLRPSPRRAFTVTSATPLDRVTERNVSRGPDGTMTLLTTDPAGLLTRLVRRPNGSVRNESPDGMIATSTNDTDLPLDISVVHIDTTTVLLPSALKSTVVSTTERTLASAGDPLSVSRTSTTVQRLGAAGAWELSHDVGAALISVQSPEGREAEASLDAKGRAAWLRSGTDSAVSITRDAQGRPTQVQQGGRSVGLTYGSNGLVSTTTDPLTRTTQYFYDAADRLTRGVLADGREITLGYDTRGNVTSVTPAGRPAHTYGYNAVNLVTEYRPPAVDATDPATRFSYDLDRALTGVTRPDGVTVGMAYDAAGRIENVTFPGGLVEFGYDPVRGNLTGVNGPYGGALALSYDGALLTQAQWIGEVAGTVGFAYDDALRVSAVTVNGADPVSYAYDEDDLLVQAGALSVTREAANGRLTATTLGSLTTGQSYSGLGELASLTSAYGGASLLDASYTRDALGRIETRTELLGGDTTTYDYTYDATGRLTQVTEDGVAVEAYSYDANGNRTSFTGPGGVVSATYDAQDRLLTYGSNAYTYTAPGELASKAVGPDTTTYTYDPLGNLLGVALPDGTDITYVVDGVGRRVGRKVNGVLERGWLYQDALNPVVELDGAGAVVSRFVYGTQSYVPDYMVLEGTTYRIVSDERGSVRMVVDVSTGAVAQELGYDAWGRVLVDTNPGFQPFGYAGGLHDPATGLVRFGARDYDAETGRWTAKDPVGLAGGLNVYGYVGGDPINFSDPFGLAPWSHRYWRALQAAAVILHETLTMRAAGFNKGLGTMTSAAVDISTATTASGSDEIADGLAAKLGRSTRRFRSPANPGAIRGGAGGFRPLMTQAGRRLPWGGAAGLAIGLAVSPDPLGAGTLTEYCTRHPDASWCSGGSNNDATPGGASSGGAPPCDPAEARDP